jgi:hypothetical protein
MNTQNPDDGRNPYAPPKSSVDDPAAPTRWPQRTASGPLYSPTQIAVAAFLGSPFAGAWFIAANYRALESPRMARKIILTGVIATVALLGIAFVLPDRFPHYLLPMVLAFACRAYAEAMFAATLKQHLSAGGSTGSWWRVVGISLLIVSVLVIIMVAVTFGLISVGVIAE